MYYSEVSYSHPDNPRSSQKQQMFELGRKFVALKESFLPTTSLLQTCTESSSSRIETTLIGAVCYDQQGCCDSQLSLSTDRPASHKSSEVLDEKARAGKAPILSK